MFTWQHLNLAAYELPLPAETEITPAALSVYKRSLDRVNMFRGHPAILVEALEILKECDSRPLVQAGIAYAIFTAAGRGEHSYDQLGLAEAKRRLEQAQAIAPAVPEINFIGVFIALFSLRNETAKVLLKPLITADSYGYYVRTALLTYLFINRSEAKLLAAHKETFPFAKTIERRAYLHYRMGSYYLELGLLNRSLAQYRELARLTPYDPWMWHNLSLIYLKKGNLWQALRCNKNALAIMDFADVHRVKEQIMRGIVKVALLLAFLTILILIVVL